jgi:hypothetical protein
MRQLLEIAEEISYEGYAFLEASDPYEKGNWNNHYWGPLSKLLAADL